MNFFQDTVLQVLDSLTDEELKKEAKNELKNDSISCIIKAAKCLVSRVPGKEDTSKDLEIFRLRMILRYIKITYSFAFILCPKQFTSRFY